MEIAEKLAEYTHKFNYNDLDEKVVHEVKRHYLDSVRCSIRGTCEPPIKKLNSEIATNILEKVFVFGASTRYLDFNDTYLSLEPAHPSDNIAPLQALAEEKNVQDLNLFTL